MTEQEWLECDNPRRMLDFFPQRMADGRIAKRPSARKLRLWIWAMMQISIYDGYSKNTDHLMVMRRISPRNQYNNGRDCQELVPS